MKKVKNGAYKGSLHIPTRKYQNYSSELSYLEGYLSRRIIPSEPEEQDMRNIILSFQNILEHEIEIAIDRIVRDTNESEDAKFLGRLKEDYVTFKAKVEWMYKRQFLNKGEIEIMKQINQLRNTLIHYRPTKRRLKLKYFNNSLFTTKTLRRIFLDVEAILSIIRKLSRSEGKWSVVPPGYAKELGW